MIFKLPTIENFKPGNDPKFAIKSTMIRQVKRCQDNPALTFIGLFWTYRQHLFRFIRMAFPSLKIDLMAD